LDQLVTKAFLLAAGLGTRLRPLTDTLPKCLLPVDGLPLLEIWLRACQEAGIRQVLVNTHWQAEKVRAFVAARRGMDIRLTHEPELLGSAGTLAANRWFFSGEESFLVLYADNLTTFPLRRLLEFHGGHRQLATVALFRADDPSACGIAELDAAGTLTGFWEKPAQPRTNLANAGLYVFRSEVEDYLPEFAPSDIGRHLLPRLVGRARGCHIHEFFMDLGTPENYRRGQIDYARARRPVVEALSLTP